MKTFLLNFHVLKHSVTTFDIKMSKFFKRYRRKISKCATEIRYAVKALIIV